MKLENKRMQDLLLHCGIKAKARYIHKGSMKRSWYIHNVNLPWTEDVWTTLSNCGFTDFWGQPLGAFSCSARLSLHVKGWDSCLDKDPTLLGFPVACLQLTKPAAEYTTQAQLLAARSVINRARALWHYRCDQDYHKNGDSGTCVLGAGIAVPLLPKGCRNPRKHMVISADEVSCCQGSLNWERSVEEIIAILKPHLPGVHYASGRMD